MTLADEGETSMFGIALADAVQSIREAIESNGIVIGVAGDLGSGKTTLVRALLRRLGVAGSVKSPTFALLEPYEVSRLHLYHFDFYRFKNPREFRESGFQELFQLGNICLVEWPERAGEYLPAVDLNIRLSFLDFGRSADVRANTEIGERCLEKLRTHLKPLRADA